MKERASGDSALRKCIAACLAIAVIPPIFIWLSFGIGRHCPLVLVPWSAGDALSYCGAISAAAIAIAGVFYSLRGNRKDEERREREDAAPFFSAIFLTARNKKDLLTDCLSKSIAEGRESIPVEPAGIPQYEEVEERRLYVIMASETSYKNRLSSEQTEKVQRRLLSVPSDDGMTLEVVNPVIYVPLRMRNIGPGAASCVRVGINRPDDEWRGACSWTIDHGEDFYLGIYIDTSYENVFGQYVIGVVFSDHLGYEYRQDFDLDIEPPQLLNQSDSQPRAQVGVSYKGRRTILNDDERQYYLQSADNLPLRDNL